MSISHLQAVFATQTGRDILPENLPMNVLISLARELAFLREGKLENNEVEQLKNVFAQFSGAFTEYATGPKIAAL